MSVGILSLAERRSEAARKAHATRRKAHREWKKWEKAYKERNRESN